MFQDTKRPEAIATAGLCRSGMADKAAFCNIPRSYYGNDQQNSVELPVPPVSFPNSYLGQKIDLFTGNDS